MRIVNGDNFDGDYPNETFLNLPNMSQEHACAVADVINNGFGINYSRNWRVVPNDYVLSPGFEP